MKKQEREKEREKERKKIYKRKKRKAKDKRQRIKKNRIIYDNGNSAVWHKTFGG